MNRWGENQGERGNQGADRRGTQEVELIVWGSLGLLLVKPRSRVRGGRTLRQTQGLSAVVPGSQHTWHSHPRCSKCDLTAFTKRGRWGRMQIPISPSLLVRKRRPRKVDLAWIPLWGLEFRALLPSALFSCFVESNKWLSLTLPVVGRGRLECVGLLLSTFYSACVCYIMHVSLFLQLPLWSRPPHLLPNKLWSSCTGLLYLVFIIANVVFSTPCLNCSYP